MSETFEKEFKELDAASKKFIEKELAEVEEENRLQEADSNRKNAEIKVLRVETGISAEKIKELETASGNRINAAIRMPAELLKPARDTSEITMREVAVARGTIFPTSIYKKLTPPAYSCGGSLAADAACVCSLAECNPVKDVRGSGWYSWTKRKVFGWFWWLYVPPKNGALYISPRWSVHGLYHLYSDDSWYNSAYAQIQLDLKTNVYQWYWDGWNIITPLRRIDDNINIWRRLDAGYSQYKSLNVTANKPVWIYNEFELLVAAKSNSARVLADFRTGAGNYIKVPWVDTYMP